MVENPLDDMIITLTAGIVAAYVSHNFVAVKDIASLIGSVHGALTAIQAPAAITGEAQPAVPIHDSIKPDYLVCLEDGQKLKLLKRHLRIKYHMSPADYRAKWGLPGNYPMVAPNYAAQRKELAYMTGLGRKGKASPVSVPKTRTIEESNV